MVGHDVSKELKMNNETEKEHLKKVYTAFYAQTDTVNLTRYGESAIDVFDENMNPIHGGFVNTNIVIILRQ